IVFLVREGNPKGIKDWNDLATSGIDIIIANPKTSGNGRYAFLGAYGYGLNAYHNDEAQTHAFVKALLSRVKVFENGGRAATTTFAQRGIGDVLITFENEANVIKHKFGNVDIIYPSYTVNAENP
ncbi:substrate-binding domain-containing protein, partial [Haemophilus influenzae]|uniref:substrate-binding domain-containing protein n=1 Tax=Haemophilus influenzae TaxID=727 RepID=UPI0013D69DCE